MKSASMVMPRLQPRVIFAMLLVMLWLPMVTIAESVDHEVVGQDTAAETSESPTIPSSQSGDYAEAFPALQLSDLTTLSKQPATLMAVLDVDQDGSLSAQEVNNSRRALLKVDANNDGTLDPEELGVDLLHPAVLRLHSLHRLLDVDGDYRLSTQEVVDAEKYLRSLDKDKNWLLDKSELYNVPSEERLALWLRALNTEALAQVGRDAELPTDGAIVDTFYLLQQIDFADSVIVGGGTQLLNANRQLVHQWPGQSQKTYGAHVELLENGLLLRTVRNQKSIGTDYASLELLDWNGNVVWSYRPCADNENCLHGSVVARKNGNIFVLLSELGESEDQVLNSILELKPSYENNATSVVSRSRIEVLPRPSVDAKNYRLDNRLAYTEEQEQLLVSDHHGERVWVIERDARSLESGKLAVESAYEIVIADLLTHAGIEVKNQVRLLELHWLSDLPGRGDVALLLDADANQFILELALPITKNGTYASDGRLEVVRRLDVFNEYQVTGVRPTAGGRYQLILGHDSLVEISMDAKQYEQRLFGRGFISDLKIFPSDFAAFKDKKNVQMNLAQNAMSPEANRVSSQAKQEPNPKKEQLTGIWSMMIETAVGDEASQLTLVQQGDLIAGNLDGEPVTIALDGNNIELTLERLGATGVVTIIYNGVVNDTDMYGEYSMASGPTIGTVRSWTAKR